MSTTAITVTTRGPWKVDDYNDDRTVVVGADGFPVAHACQVAILPGYSERLGVDAWAGHKGKAFIERPIHEARGNAKLIANAPKLLLLLRLVDDFVFNGTTRADEYDALKRDVAAAVRELEAVR